ncbi:hypothetical protein ACFPRL_32645 [Pseudoclavibacter helvolus]
MDGGEQDTQAHLACTGLRQLVLFDRQDVLWFAESGVGDGAHVQSSETVIVTSMLPRVAFE